MNAAAGTLLLQLEILWPAMLAGALVLATHVPMGREVLQRGIIFLDLAIAQMAAFGVIAAQTLQATFSAPALSHHHGHGPGAQTATAIVVAVIASLGLYLLRRRDVRVQEALIGILFILSATGSILLLSLDPHGGERLKAMLVGQILWISADDLIALALAYTGVLVAFRFTRGRFAELAFYPLFAITITLSTQLVGVYLVFASLMIPALATFGVERAIGPALAIGLVGYLSGLILAALWDLPGGATIVWTMAIAALIFRGSVAFVANRRIPQE